MVETTMKTATILCTIVNHVLILIYHYLMYRLHEDKGNFLTYMFRSYLFVLLKEYKLVSIAGTW